MIELIGWTGSFLLAVCGLPLLLGAVQSPQIAKQMSGAFLYCWLLGEILVLGYAATLGEAGLPLWINYVTNIVCILGVLWIRWRPEE